MTVNDAQKANRVKWVRALLSGDYPQGDGYLKVVTDGTARYCCLGVACEVVNPESPRLVLRFAGDHADWYMHAEELTLFGMTETDQVTASRWNDTNGFTFARIADHVAYATENDSTFTQVDGREHEVPEGYAAEWLTQLAQSD